MHAYRLARERELNTLGVYIIDRKTGPCSSTPVLGEDGDYLDACVTPAESQAMRKGSQLLGKKNNGGKNYEVFNDEAEMPFSK